MADFSNLQSLHVKDGDTAEFVFYGIAGEPTLEVKPATAENKPFFNRVLAKNKQLQRKRKGRAEQLPTATSILEARKEDIEMFVELIIVGWSNVLDASGKAVKYSAENCRQFLNAIPGDMFDELRTFCLDISNYRDQMDAAELEDLSGN